MFVKEEHYEINVNCPISFGTRTKYKGRSVPDNELGPFAVYYFTDHLEVYFLKSRLMKYLSYADVCPEGSGEFESCWVWCETAVMQYAVYAFPI